MLNGLIPISYFKMEDFTTSNNLNNLPKEIEVTIDIEDCISKNFSITLQVQNIQNESLKLKLEKYLKYELNKELRRITFEDKVRSTPKNSFKDRYKYLPAVYHKANKGPWLEFYKLNDSLQTAFTSTKPFIK
jgi:hypothetical protein